MRRSARWVLCRSASSVIWFVYFNTVHHEIVKNVNKIVKLQDLCRQNRYIWRCSIHNSFLSTSSVSSGQNVVDLKRLIAKQNRKEGSLSDFNTDEESQNKYDKARSNQDAEEVAKIRAHLLEKTKLADIPSRRPRPTKRPLAEIHDDPHQQLQQMSFVASSLGPVAFRSSAPIVGLGNGSNGQIYSSNQSSISVIESTGAVSVAEDLGLPTSAIVVETVPTDLFNAGLGGTLPAVYHHPDTRPPSQTVTPPEEDVEEEDDDIEDIDNFGGENLDDDLLEDDEDNGHDNRGERASIEPPYSPPAVQVLSVGPGYCTVAQYKVSHIISRRADSQC